MNWLPGWDSANSVEAWHRFFEIGGIVLFSVVVIFEALSYIYGQRMSSLDAAEKTTLRAEVATADERARNAEFEAERLSNEFKAEQRGRLLPDDQISRLSILLTTIRKPTEPVYLMGIQGDREAVGLSEQLYKIFLSAGFKVDGPWADTIIGGIGKGIAVRQKHKGDALGVAISSALQDVGLTTQIIEKSELKPNHVEVIVGSRP